MTNVLSKSISICISKHELKDHLYKKSQRTIRIVTVILQKKTLQFCFKCDCHLIQIQKLEYIKFLISVNFTPHLNNFLEKFNSLNLKTEDPPPRFLS